jgi:hypothetical protein
MPDPPPRRFTLLDAMTMIAATAVGLALGRVLGPPAAGPVRPAELFVTPAGGWTIREIALRAATAWAPVIPCLVAWTFAVLALQLRRPRLPWGRLAGQPGLVAGLVAVITLALHAAALLAAAWFDGRFSYATPDRFQAVALNAALLLAHRVGWSVIVAWSALALSGRWPSGPAWPERLGRLVGVGWILSFLLTGYRVDQVVWWGNFVGQG